MAGGPGGPEVTAGVCHHVAMSDDDLWSRTPSSADEPPDDEPADEPIDEPADPVEQAPQTAPVSDETQPLSGLGSHPEAADAPADVPAPETPPVGSVPPPANPYGAPQQYGAPPPQNPSGATTPYPTAPPPYGQPYAQQPDPGQPYAAPYGQAGAYPPPPANPYPQPGSFDQVDTPPSPYGSPYAPAYAGGMLPDHPSATTAMVFGILGLVGMVVCQVLLFFSPFAWVIGSRAVKEIDREPGRYGGRDKAMAGKVMGIIGTVVLVLGIAALVAVFAFAIGSTNSSVSYGTE